MKLSSAISHLQSELDTRGDIDLFFIDKSGNFLYLKEITSLPINQEEASWGIDSCFWILGETPTRKILKNKAVYK